VYFIDEWKADIACRVGHSEDGGGRLKWKRHTSCPTTIHGVLNRVGVRLLALTREFLLAIHTLSAGNLEGGNNTVAFLELGDRGAPFEDSAAELVT